MAKEVGVAPTFLPKPDSVISFIRFPKIMVVEEGFEPSLKGF
jgi:hypothetical protein